MPISDVPINVQIIFPLKGERPLFKKNICTFEKCGFIFAADFEV